LTDPFRKEYKEIGDAGNQLITDIKDAALKLHDLIGTAESVGTAGLDIEIAKQKVIEAVMWAVHGITA